MEKSLIFTRNVNPWVDLPLRAWHGEHISHVSINLGNGVIVDSTLLHGVQRWKYEDWKKNKEIVVEIPVRAYSPIYADAADIQLQKLVGISRYDLWKLIGFPLLRDIDDPDKYICSEIALQWFCDRTGYNLPGRKGRIDVRHVLLIASAYENAHTTTPIGFDSSSV